MRTKKIVPPGSGDQRNRAEGRLETEGEEPGLPGSDMDQKALLHELHVRQIEMEMQNEELRRTQQESDELAEKYIDLYDFAPVGYFTTDPIGTILEVNQTGSELLGKDRQSLIGTRLGRFLHPESIPSFKAFCGRVLSSGHREMCDVVLPGAPGQKPWYAHIDGWGELEGQAEPGRIRLVLTNISETTFRTVMDSLNTVVYVADMKTYEILFVNQCGRKIWGDITGQICWRTIHENQAGPCPFCNNDNLVDSAGNPTGILTRVYQDPITRRWYECRDSAIQWIDGRIVRLEIATDITDHKQAESALRQANRQLNLLSSITRHDINNKIMVILGYLDIVEMESRDPAIAEFFPKLKSATNAIKSQIEFTRIYQDLGSQEPQWQPLCTVLIRVHMPPEITLVADVEGIQVYADLMLEKVFFNLLDNSIRHGRKVTEVRVSMTQSEAGLTIVWEDNGVGVPDAEKERIFERGFGENTGLGLFLVREVLSLTGISIRETGTPGNGARFEIMVPRGMYRTAAGEVGVGGSE